MDQRSILFVPEADTDDPTSQVLGSISGVANVDIVVAGNGAVIKDRHGDATEVLTLMRSRLAVRELSREPGETTPALLGVPLDCIGALTMDGAHWIEVMGPITAKGPLGGPTLTFRVGQAPGGKLRKLGIGVGDTITVLQVAVAGVRRKTEETLGRDPRDPGQR